MTNHFLRRTALCLLASAAFAPAVTAQASSRLEAGSAPVLDLEPLIEPLVDWNAVDTAPSAAKEAAGNQASDAAMADAVSRAIRDYLDSDKQQSAGDDAKVNAVSDAIRDYLATSDKSAGSEDAMIGAVSEAVQDYLSGERQQAASDDAKASAVSDAIREYLNKAKVKLRSANPAGPLTIDVEEYERGLREAEREQARRKAEHRNDDTRKQHTIIVERTTIDPCGDFTVSWGGNKRCQPRKVTKRELVTVDADEDKINDKPRDPQAESQPPLPAPWPSADLPAAPASAPPPVLGPAPASPSGPGSSPGGAPKAGAPGSAPSPGTGNVNEPITNKVGGASAPSEPSPPEPVW